MELIVIIASIVIYYVIGKNREEKHYKSIRKREADLIKKPYISFEKKVLTNKNIKEASLVSSSIVIGCDCFKYYVGKLKNIFGGNISAFEKVMDRARREAILRIREQALQKNADIVVNVKIDTVMLDPIIYSNNNLPKCCVTAYGTAVKYAK